VCDPTHQLSVHVLHVCRVLPISELHPLCTVCTTIAPRVLHFSAVHFINVLENLITVGMQSRQWDSTVFNDAEEVGK